MAEEKEITHLLEGQGCSQTMHNAGAANLEQLQQGGSQTSQNVQQAVVAIANQQQTTTPVKKP